MRRLQILFVDSDTYAHRKMHQVLDEFFDVQCVASLAEAKFALETALPDILISEVLLGQESGLALCHYVRSSERLCALPIMLLTSLATLYDKVHGFEAGTDDYVVKPFDTHHLIARIRLLARIKRLEQRITV